MTVRRVFKYRLYPGAEQQKKLQHVVDLCRELNNAALEERREAWKKGVSIHRRNQVDQIHWIRKECPEFQEIYNRIMEDVLGRIGLTFDGFFRRVHAGKTPGYPRFKESNRYDSFTYPVRDRWWWINPKSNDHLYLRGIGLIKVKDHKPVRERIVSLTIKREGDKWYACFNCEIEVNPQDCSGLPHIAIDTLTKGTLRSREVTEFAALN